MSALKTIAAFTEMISSRGTVEGDEDVIGDGIAFAGVAKYPARVKCALLGWMAFKDALAAASAENDALCKPVRRFQMSDTAVPSDETARRPRGGDA